MRRTFPTVLVVARNINKYLHLVDEYHRRRSRHLYPYPEVFIGMILGTLEVIQYSRFTRREYATLLWHLKRWRKHRVVQSAPRAYELPWALEMVEGLIQRRWRSQ